MEPLKRVLLEKRRVAVVVTERSNGIGGLNTRVLGVGVHLFMEMSRKLIVIFG